MTVLNSLPAMHRAKPWIAMAVAYVVALQILLTGVLVSQNAGAVISADPARIDIICFGAGSDGGAEGKGTHTARQACCVLCNVPVGPALLAASVALPRAPYDGGAVSYIAPAPVAPAAPLRTPRLSQGPPQHA
jgi:hypothetical protein